MQLAHARVHVYVCAIRTTADVKKLKEHGLHSADAILMTSKKELAKIKGLSENKVDKIYDCNTTAQLTAMPPSWASGAHEPRDTANNKRRTEGGGSLERTTKKAGTSKHAETMQKVEAANDEALVSMHSSCMRICPIHVMCRASAEHTAPMPRLNTQYPPIVCRC